MMRRREFITYDTEQTADGPGGLLSFSLFRLSSMQY